MKSSNNKIREVFNTVPVIVKEFIEIKRARHEFLLTGSEYEPKAIEANVIWYDKSRSWRTTFPFLNIKMGEDLWHESRFRLEFWQIVFVHFQIFV